MEIQNIEIKTETGNFKVKIGGLHIFDQILKSHVSESGHVLCQCNGENSLK